VDRSGPILILGASVRGAAFSALRAGLSPTGIDLFADLDLRTRCPARRLMGRYPDGFREAVAGTPWMYTGGLENHPDVVADLERRGPLLGVGASALRRMRSPRFLVDAARRAGLPAPLVVDEPPPSEASRWLVKPRAGSGGAGIAFWRTGDPLPIRESYWQEYVEGIPVSAIFISDNRRTQLVALTRQLVGAAWVNARPFRYCGSLGPIAVEGALRVGLERLGEELRESRSVPPPALGEGVRGRGCFPACEKPLPPAPSPKAGGGRKAEEPSLARRANSDGLRGLFGVDGVLRDGAYWPVELNPRYTASVEVVEHATGLRALDLHVRACRGESLADVWASVRVIVGKAVLFAPTGLCFPEDGPWREALRVSPEELADYGDIPEGSTTIETGQPILTVFAKGESMNECERRLRERAATTWEILHDAQ
jgi:uncharacterized protein